MKNSNKNNFLRFIRISLAILTGIATSYIGTYFYEHSILSNFKQYHPLLDVKPNYLFFIIFFLFLTTIYGFKEQIVLFLFTYPNLGRIIYSINVKSVFRNTAFKYSCTSNQLRSNIKSYMDEANSFDVLMISGAKKGDDNLQKFVLDQLEKICKANKQKKYTIFLLNPKSQYVIQRADELYSDKNEKNNYIQRHKKSIENMKNIYGEDHIILYDELPIWRIFRLGKIMYVSRYTDNLSAAQTVTIGYGRPDSNNKDFLSNQYVSYERYMKYLSEKYKNYKGKSDIIKEYVVKRINTDLRDDTIHGISCNCCYCMNDIINLISVKLKDQSIDFNTAINSNAIENIYIESRNKVFNNKHCELIINH